jgi:hypothetical protein
MEELTNVFSINDIFSASNYNIDKMINQIKKGNLNDILSELCYIKNNVVIIDYIYFKY